MKEETISQILNKAKIDDIVTNGTLYWRVTEQYEEDDKMITWCLPIDEEGGILDNGFEITSFGLEEHVVLPNLRILR